MSNKNELKEIQDHILKSVGSDSVQCVEQGDELVLHLESDVLLSVCRFLRDDARCCFKVCVDVCGVDYPERSRRFDVVYHLLSIKHNIRLRIKVEADEMIAVPSVTSIWPSAGWYEREVWDMYGVMFSDHADLRRILTDYGFQGHPQRKDFPLSGYVEVRYDMDERRVKYEPVKLTQAFREFSFSSPWEGYQDLLPGDEKATSDLVEDKKG